MCEQVDVEDHAEFLARWRGEFYKMEQGLKDELFERLLERGESSWRIPALARLHSAMSNMTELPQNRAMLLLGKARPKKPRRKDKHV